MRKGAPVGADVVRADFLEEKGLCWALKDDRVQNRMKAFEERRMV